MVDIEAEKKLIKQAIQENFEAEKRGDVEASLKFYSDDVLCLGPNVPITEGIQPMRGLVEEVLKSFVSSKHEIIHVGVSKSGDLGYAIAKYQMVTEGPEGHIEEIGKFHSTMKKIDDAWKCVVLSWNSDKPLE